MKLKSQKQNKMSIKEKINKLSVKFYKEIASARQHIHTYPELSFQEYKTAAFVCKKLKEYKISFKKGIAGTGIIALIEGKNPSKKIIALRSELDALPISEANNIEYKSKNKGVMHACGHDVHTGCLLGAAKILSQLKDEFEGTVKLIFQPGEEKLPGGASLMIKAGVLKNPEPFEMIALHVLPALEVGKVGFRSGKYMASADEIYLTVKGKGGHAAMPDEYNNPLLIASEILLNLRSAFANYNDKKIPTVLAFGKIIGNGATNVIPSEVKIEGTFRTMDEQWRKSAHQKIKNIAKRTAQSLKGKCEVDIHIGYPCLVNNEKLTPKIKNHTEEFLGKENIVDLDLRMTSEDFAFYSEYVPVCFFRLGVGNKSKGISSPVHTSTFNIDEKALRVGMGLMAWIAVKELQIAD